jgi:hypothetical protein
MGYNKKMNPFSSDPENTFRENGEVDVGQPVETFAALRSLTPGTVVAVNWPSVRREIFKILPPVTKNDPTVGMTSQATNVEAGNFNGSIVTIVGEKYFQQLQSAGAGVAIVPTERVTALLAEGLRFCYDLYEEEQRQASAWRDRLGTGQ